MNTSDFVTINPHNEGQIETFSSYRSTEVAEALIRAGKSFEGSAHPMGNVLGAFEWR